MSKHMRLPGITAAATSGPSGSVAMMKLPIGNTRRCSCGTKPSAYAFVATNTSLASTVPRSVATRNPSPMRLTAVARVCERMSTPAARARAASARWNFAGWSAAVFARSSPP